jgi:hypothetical protein
MAPTSGGEAIAASLHVIVEVPLAAKRRPATGWRYTERF